MIFALMMACAGGGADSGGLPEAGPPDVAGRYNVMGLGVAGCDGQTTWQIYVEPWVAGPLEVDGEGGSLDFDFGQEMSFSGGVDGSGATTFGGETEWAGASLVVSFVGSFTEEESQWLLEGTLSSELDDDDVVKNNCTLDVSIEAYEIVGL